MEFIKLIEFLLVSGCKAEEEECKEETPSPFVRRFNMNTRSYMAGNETGEVVLTFSSPVPEFNSLADVNVPSGSLSKMTSSDNITWKGVFTPSLNTKASSNEMTLKTILNVNGGNNYEIIGTSPNYIVDTLNLSVERFIISSTTLISTLDSSAAKVTLIFSEPLIFIIKMFFE